MFSMKSIERAICVVVWLLLLTVNEGVESKGYRESKINKVIRIETTSKSVSRPSLSGGCSLNTLQVSNFMNTGRWRKIRNKLGTGWDEDLVPPLMFCVKVVDKPTNTLNTCNKNGFDLILIDGIRKSRNSVVLATVGDVLKGEEKCVFLSPCEILRHIYWDDNNFKNRIDNLEFRVAARFESTLPGQRFISMVSVSGVARSMKKAKNPWDADLKLVQKFKNVQALSMFIPYKTHSKGLISDACVIKPRVTSIFYGKNKPSMCKFSNCMWNIWIGQLSGEFVNERCTLGRASSRGDYIVGWFSPYAIDSETVGSAKLKIQWASSEGEESSCSIDDIELEKRISDYYGRGKETRGNFKSDWFPNDKDHRYEVIREDAAGSDNTKINTRLTETNNTENSGDTRTFTPPTDALDNGSNSTITTTTSTSTTTTSTSTSTHKSTSPAKPKISIIGPDSKNMRLCVNGKCARAGGTLWPSCHSNRTRYLSSSDWNNERLNPGVDDIQIEWVEIDENSTKVEVDRDGSVRYNVDGYIDNRASYVNKGLSLESNPEKDGVVSSINGTSEESGTCKEHACACMLDGLVEEDITIVDKDDGSDDDDDDGDDNGAGGQGGGAVHGSEDDISGENGTESTDFVKVGGGMDNKLLLKKWLELKKIYES